MLLVQGVEVVFPFLVFESTFFADDGYSLDPIGFEFRSPHGRYERGRVPAVSEPTFLPPANESRRTMRNFLNHCRWRFLPALADHRGIDEIHIQTRVRRSIRDAPRTD